MGSEAAPSYALEGSGLEAWSTPAAYGHSFLADRRGQEKEPQTAPPRVSNAKRHW